MRNILLIFFAFHFAACSLFEKKGGSHERFGTGLLNLSTSRKIPLYKSSNASQPFDTICLLTDREGITRFRAQLFSTRLEPYLVSDGDSRQEASARIQSGLIGKAPQLYLRVLSRKNDMYTVLIGEQSGQKAVIKSVDGTTASSCFQNWETYLRDAFCLLPLSDSMTIFTEPGGGTLRKTNRTAVHALTVKGRWLEIGGHNKQSLGWIRWRDDRRLLVQPFKEMIE